MKKKPRKSGENTYGDGAGKILIKLESIVKHTGKSGLKIGKTWRSFLMTKTENRRRFVSIEEYRRNTGFSYKTVNHLLETGQIPYITTEGGYRKVDTLPGGDVSYKELTEKLDRLERAVCAMAKHFGVKG